MLSLLEEMFFFQYHLNYDMDKAMRMPIFWRRWFVERFIAQKERESEHIQREQEKAKQAAKRQH